MSTKPSALFCLALLAVCTSGRAQDAARATYLANAGVMVERGTTKILFDPLFNNAFDRFDLVPDAMTASLFAGEPPFDGVDAVFVSHVHRDHFEPRQMLTYLRAQKGVRLYAPLQAVKEMREHAEAEDEVFARTVGVALELEEPSVSFAIDGVDVHALRLPHAGWPTRMTDIENLVFSVTLDGATTVMHFGDAEGVPDRFAPHADFWTAQQVDLALPPYWFFLNDDGKAVLDEHVRATHAVGVHVPAEMPDIADERPAELHGYDLFTEPGETRPIP